MEKPLTKEDLRYVDWFRKTRDVTRAGERAGLGPIQAKRLHERIEIQEEIERQDNIVLGERARVQVEAENINNDILDRELLKLILLDAEKNPDAKRRSIELGYVLTGRIQAGNTRSLDLAPATDDTPLSTVYQAFIPVGVPVEVCPILPDQPVPVVPKLPESTPKTAVVSQASRFKLI
jgi:hypothetical protein